MGQASLFTSNDYDDANEDERTVEASKALALAKEIVSLHKGTIKAENDSGAVFEISLPVKNR